MNAIVGLVCMFLLAVIVLSSLKGAAFLEDPDPIRNERQERADMIANLEQIERHRPHHIIQTINDEYEEHKNS